MELTQGIRRNAHMMPDRRTLIALPDQVAPRITEHLEFEEVSCAQLEDRVARLAGWFRDAGVHDGERVAFIGDNSHRHVTFYFASLWAGGVMVSVNTRWAAAEISHCLRDSGATVLVVEAPYVESVAAMLDADPALAAQLTLKIVAGAASRSIHGFETWEQGIEANAAIADARRGHGDIAALFYTGGTTGQSKGVVLSHSNFMVNAMTAIANMNFTSESAHLHISPMFHVAGGSRVFSISVAGGVHVPLPRFDPNTFLRVIEQCSVTVTVVVPTMLARLTDMGALVDQYDLSSLELLTYGASPMPEALLRRAMQQFPDVDFLQSYGMTELSPVATVLPASIHRNPDDVRIRSIGRAVLNAEVRVVDSDDVEQPRGEVGEIVVRGPMVMQGYWNLPELTEETLRGGWMHTGDAGYMDEQGYIFLVDRIKDMIVSGGENVFSAEVENVLYQHAAVAECAVIGIPSQEWGESVHAVVRLRDGEEADEQALQEHCRAHIAGYKVPRSVDIVADELPKSGPGKILKTELRSPYWADQERMIH